MQRIVTVRGGKPVAVVWLRMMFEIKPNCLYSLEDIGRELSGELTARQFVDTLRPRKVFKGLWLGEHLLKAIQERAEHKREGRVEAPRRGRHRKTVATVEKIAMPTK